MIRLLPAGARLAALALAFSLPAVAQTTAYTASPCGNAFEDISATGTQLLGGAYPDDGGEVVPLGFSFEFFGATHTTIGVSTNGYLSFGSDLSDFTSDPIPSASDPNDLIAPYWDDWAPNDGGDVHWATLGSAPSRRFVAQWTAVPPFGGGDVATFQALLFEGTDRIEFRYRVPLPIYSPTVGLENPTGTAGVDAAPILFSDSVSCIRFEPDTVVDLLCEEFDRFATLTPQDTLTIVASQHNPEQEQGFLWAYAVDGLGRGIGRDALVGQLLVVDGLEALEYGVNAVDYRAAVAPGALTDVDTDGIRDLDGVEYERTAGELLVPRFLGSDPGRQTRGELVLLGLSGGAAYDTTVNLLVYNDDEDQFSASHTFYCWDKVDTLAVSNTFSNAWLRDFSGQNPAKGLGNLEYGWFRLDGGVASSDFFSLPDPAVYAVYVEKVGQTAAADLPFETCAQSGHLLPRAVGGDNSETSGAPSDEDCGVRLPRRRAGSLLLYPEFDSRTGVATVITVTNTSADEDVRVHFVYVGRYGS